jgi:hypothetical protein
VTSPANRLQVDPHALEQLLRTGQVRRAPANDAPGAGSKRTLSIGVSALDAALGGGLVRGQLHEIVAPASAGGTALLRAALGAATRAGELCALVDLADAFDPRGARAAGLELRRLLWVRPATPAQALRAAEIALESRFALVAIDLVVEEGERGSRGPSRSAAGSSSDRIRLVRFEGPRKKERTGDAPWARLARRAEKHGGTLLVLSRTAQAGAFAAATLELSRAQPRWEGSPGTPGRLLRAGAALGAVARSRRGPPSAPLLLQLPVVAEGAEDPPRDPPLALQGAE